MRAGRSVTGKNAVDFVRNCKNMPLQCSSPSFYKLSPIQNFLAGVEGGGRSDVASRRVNRGMKG